MQYEFLIVCLQHAYPHTPSCHQEPHTEVWLFTITSSSYLLATLFSSPFTTWPLLLYSTYLSVWPTRSLWSILSSLAALP